MSLYARKSLLTPYIPALTGLRAWAFGLVLLDHWIPFFHHLFMAGNGGVSLFLVLSGYLISRILIASKLDHNPFQDYIIEFYRRRAQRIFPLYFLILFILLLIGNQVIRHQWVYFFTFTANHYLINYPDVLLDHLWSLSAEEQLYLFIPLLIWFFPLCRLPLLAYLLIASSCLFRGMAYFWYTGPTWWASSYESVLGCLDCYGIGLLVAYSQLIKPDKANQFFSSGILLRALFMLWLAVLLLGIYWEVSGWGAYSNPATAVCVRLSIALFGGYLIGYCCHNVGWWGKHLLLNPVVQFLGQISYGLYLIHNIVYNAHMPTALPARSAWNMVVRFIFPTNWPIVVSHHYLELTFYLLLTILLASFSWYLVEKPILNRATKHSRQILLLPDIK